MHINVVINWPLSKQGIRWPVSPDRIAGSGVDPASFLKMQAGKTFSYHGHVLVTLHVQFLCSDWLKNLTGEFVRKIYAASWKLFTLAEADRVLSQLVMFLTVFFHWMYKMKYSCYQECSLIHGWFVYWVFGWEMRRLSKPIIRFRMASFLFSPCWMRVRIIKAQVILALLDSFQELHLEIW